MRHAGNLLAAKLLKKQCANLSVRLRNDWWVICLSLKCTLRIVELIYIIGAMGMIAEFSIEGWRLDRAKGDTEGMVLE